MNFSRKTKQTEVEIRILCAICLGKHLIQLRIEYNSRAFLKRHFKKLKLYLPPFFSMYGKALLRKQTFPCALIG